MHQFNGTDSIFLYSEKAGSSQNMTGVMIYDQSTAPGGTVRYMDILRFLEDRLVKLPMFRRRLYEVPFNLDRPYWIEDENFEISQHVHHIALPKPSDWRQLCILTAHLHSLPMDLSKPLWEIYVIEGLDHVEGYPPGCFAIALKNHHCALDGATGMLMLDTMHDKSAKPSRRKKKPDEPYQLGKSEPLTVMQNAVRNNLASPFKTMKVARNFLDTRKKTLEIQQQLGEHDEELDIPVTRFQGPIGRQRVVEGISLDFEELRKIKSIVSAATINDVLLTITSGAIRSYLEDKNELPDTSLAVGCPVDIRTPEERESGGNMIGSMMVKAHTDIEDPVERLAAICQSTVIAKHKSGSGSTRLLSDATNSLTSPLLNVMAKAMSSEFVARQPLLGNFALSNMPGPTSQLYMCGAKLVGMVNGPPLEPGLGLIHAATSSVINKKGVITLGFASTPEMMPDPKFYRECLRNSFDSLCKVAKAAK